MKKQWFWLGLGAFGLAAVPLWLFQGCASNPPPLSSIVPTPLPVNMVSNFHDGSLFVNPALSNGTGGYFTAETYGGAIGLNNEIDGSVNPNVLLIRPDTGQYAIHLYGMEYDTPANTANPAMELFCFLKNNPADMANPYIYDLSSFTGVKFDYLTPADDKSSNRFFEIGITLDTPPPTDPAGTCPPVFGSNCYNYFSVNISKSATWTTMTVPFNTMHIRFKPNGANPVGLTTANALSGNVTVNGQVVPAKTQALFLLWSFNNGGGGSPPAQEFIDYWVDNIEFY